jgi:hypothetical protein
MDFNTYLKEVHGYQKGDRISADKARALRVQFANVGNVVATQKADANAIQASISMQIENATKKGTPIDARIIEGASNLFNTGQFEKAQSLISDASKNIAETTKQQSEAQQTELENKNLTIQQEKLQQEQQDLIRQKEEGLSAAKRTIDSVNTFLKVDPKTNEFIPTQKLDETVGYGEQLATTISKYVPILGLQSPEERSAQKELSLLLESDILKAASALKPVSNVDLQMLIRNRPEITDPPEMWLQTLKNIKEILGNKDNYIESTEAAAPLTAGQKLRAKTSK